MNVLIEGFTFPGVESAAGVALGNYLGVEEFMDFVLGRDGATLRLFSNIAFLLSRSVPGETTRMAICVIEKFVGQSADRLFAHPHIELITAGLINCMHDVDKKDYEAYCILTDMLKHPAASKVVLAGSNVSKMIQASGEILSSKRSAPLLRAACCDLLLALADATEPSIILLAAPEVVPKVVAGLCATKIGKKLLDNLIPLLQWKPELVSEVSLAYKRVWVSTQIRRARVKEREAKVSRNRRLVGAGSQGVGKLWKQHRFCDLTIQSKHVTRLRAADRGR